MNSLQILAQHRDALLLAEVAGLLHDWQKCIDKAVAAHWEKNPNLTQKARQWQQRKSKPGEFADILKELSLPAAFLSHPHLIDLKCLCEEGKNPSKASKHCHPAVRLLGLCHDVAHVDKELDTNQFQDQACDRISTAFGFEFLEPSELFNPLISEVAPLLKDKDTVASRRRNILSATQKVLSEAWGDTRRPINEVTLWDWGYAVASLYKSILAGKLLGAKNEHWRLLHVNFDVLGLYAKAVKIADLVGYQNAVKMACDKIKQLVEEEYPLGNEIYCDTTGIYFTFPDLDLPVELDKEIRRRVEDVEPELAPRIYVTEGDGKDVKEQLKSILAKARGEAIKALQQPFNSSNPTLCWQQLWQNLPEGKWELCPVCRLRPKAENAETCCHCEQRRVSRLETWRENPGSTIWLGEIADHNGRCALLVGKFGLDDWLSGTLVQTMLVKAQCGNPNECVPKNPSPARLRRVWENCQRFWKETVLESIIPRTVAERRRKHIILNGSGWKYGLYDGILNGKPLDLFWFPDRNAFLTVSNPQIVGEIKNGDTFHSQGQKIDAAIQQAEDVTTSDPFAKYRPWLSLLATPDQFLVLLPATDALKVVRKIQEEYVSQFGKMRNRLPLSIGLIYFEQKMPLMAVMDAARQMLRRTFNSEQWTVNSVDTNGRVDFGNGITWQVPTLMGDNITYDLWYPYFCVDGKLTRKLYFAGPNGEHWVHVKCLQGNDTVYLTPSTFDFLWLDTTARRFEINYDANGRRPRRTRPFYLEDLDRLETLWSHMKHLTRTQRHQVIRTIEATREAWYGQDSDGKSTEDKVFRQFVADTLAGAGWPQNHSWKSIPEEWREKLVRAGARGELADLAELHMEILKE